MQVRLAHSGGAPKLQRLRSDPPSGLWIYSYNNSKGFFFSLLAVELPIPSLTQSIIKFTFKISEHCDLWACQSCTDQTNFSALSSTLGIFSSGVQIFISVSAVLLLHPGWAGALLLIVWIILKICCYSWLVYPVCQVWRHKEISDVHIWCFNKVFKSLHIVLHYW